MPDNSLFPNQQFPQGQNNLPVQGGQQSMQPDVKQEASKQPQVAGVIPAVSSGSSLNMQGNQAPLQTQQSFLQSVVNSQPVTSGVQKPSGVEMPARMQMTPRMKTTPGLQTAFQIPSNGNTAQSGVPGQPGIEQTPSIKQSVTTAQALAAGQEAPVGKAIPPIQQRLAAQAVPAGQTMAGGQMAEQGQSLAALSGKTGAAGLPGQSASGQAASGQVVPGLPGQSASIGQVAGLPRQAASIGQAVPNTQAVSAQSVPGAIRTTDSMSQATQGINQTAALRSVSMQQNIAANPQVVRSVQAPDMKRPLQQASFQTQRPLQQSLRTGFSSQKPANPKKLIIGCFGCSGFALMLFIILVLIFVGQTTSTGENPLARSLGLEPGTMVNTLILLVNLIFGSISVLLFLMAIIGLFRFFMARKDDRESKKKGFSMAGVSGLLLMIFVFIWVGISLFLSSKKIPVEKAQTNVIITDPKNTLGLTAPVNIKFDASNLAKNQKYQILSYLWTFGDGTTSTLVTPTHTYKDKGSNNGRYDIKLEVTKREKQTNKESVDTYTAIVTIADVELNATFKPEPASGPAPLTVEFDAGDSSSPGAKIETYDWDFDNNNIFDDGEGEKITHTFTQEGQYKVNLRITDDTGQFKVNSQEITVTGAAVPVAVINIPTTDGKYYAGVQYSFQGEKSASPKSRIEKYEWDFGDGSPKANTRTASHIYKKSGTFEVKLKVTDEEGATGDTVKQLKVEIAESAPIAVIETVPPLKEKEEFIAGTVPFEVIFDAGKSQDPDKNIVDYQWDFDGDGTNDDTGARVNFVYKNEGLFNATVTVIDAENNESKAVMVVKAGSQPLQARMTATPVDGVYPLIVTFDASSSFYPGGKIVSYEWDFGDGSPKQINAAKVIYKYTKVGTWIAKVKARASDDSTSTTQIPINVRPVALTACFKASAEEGPAPLTVEFDPYCASGTIAKYTWDFGDGQTSKTRKPSHTFSAPGSYKVTLEVSDPQNVIQIFTKDILVTGQL